MPQDKGVLVIFDLVSTLTDAGPRYAQAFIEVTAKAGFAPPDKEDVLSMLGNKNLGEITDAFARGLDAEGKKKFMADCNAACDILLTRPGFREQLFPHVREAVETMHLRGVTLGIYTGTREDAMAAQLNYHNLAGVFDTRYIRGKNNERDAGKKNEALKAEQLRSIVAAFRAEQGREVSVIVIGDSSADAKAAEREGLFFIGFGTTPAKKAELQQAGVKQVVSDFGDVPDLVHRLMQPAANDADMKPGAQPKPAGGKFQP